MSKSSSNWFLALHSELADSAFRIVSRECVVIPTGLHSGMVDAFLVLAAVPPGRKGRIAMRIVRRSLALVLALLMMAPTAVRAQSHVIDRSVLEQALRERVSQDRADREAIVALLHRSEVQEIAARAGLSLTKAESAVATLQGDELRELASQARQAEDNLAGGSSNIVISTTTIIIILLIVILIVVIAD
jgi:hypothetical protein